MSPSADASARRPVRLMQVVGARPQFVKLAPVCRAIAAANAAGGRIESFVVHTGQHYDPAMSDVFFSELGIPEAHLDLGIGSGSHGRQTARMLESLEAAMVEHEPDLVLTYGDTNSTLAATLAAAKLHLPLAHVEAGLRSFNRNMPEEANRLVADHLSDLLFAPTPASMKNLANEGLGSRARRVGDVMLDAMRAFAPVALERSRVLERLGLTAGDYYVATVHRAENTEGERLEQLTGAIARVARNGRPVIFPLHPRTAKAIAGGFLAGHAGVKPIDPLGYLDMIRLVAGARIVLTDSGGLQKEAFFLGRPCVTLRDETEWVETVEAGGNTIAGTDPGRILGSVSDWERVLAAGPPDFTAALGRAFGDGRASARIVDESLAWLARRAQG
jgi:UDP-GlcNAc3NAcA epimerase